MTPSCRAFSRTGFLIAAAALLPCGHAYAQGFGEPGKSIGTVTTQGDLIVVTLNEGALGKSNMFDLAHRTMRFTPEAGGYRAENLALQWDAEFGAAMTESQVTLHNFAFPFSGKSWDSFSVGITGSIAFGPPAPTPGAGGGGGRGGRGGGVTIERFDQLQEAARTLVNRMPAICVFMKPRMSGTRYVKELEDRVVVTWNVTEPYGGIQDFTWVPTVNRFQAVLRKDGSIDLSYDQLAARDAIVGVYPMVNAGVEKELGSVAGEAHPAAAANLDIANVKLSAVDGLFLKVTFETRGPVLPDGDPAVPGISYRVKLGDAEWTIRGGGGRGGRGGAGRYAASGPGVAPAVKVNGNTISVQGMLPPALSGSDHVAVSATASPAAAAGATPAPASQVGPKTVPLSGIHSAAVDLSAVKKQDGPFAVAYEAFHYYSLPSARDMTCTVIKALGDKFDFLAYYSDFRVDNQEAGTPSNGPLGGGPAGGAVTGIGANQRGLDSYCTAGRFQWQFIQPVYSGANQMQEHSPEGVNVDRAGGGKMTGYNLAMSQIGHEMGHRWAAFVSAKVKDEVIPLGPTHWARGLQAPVAFPYKRATEASAMGGGAWQDNYDGTFTQLDDDYYVPATGWSHLDLYLMGMIPAAEVPDFYILRNLAPAGRDANGHPIFKADRTKVTIQDVIAVEGPRLPTPEQSQKKFNTGMVVMVEHGKTPSRELIERTNGIREAWMDYWSVTTGRRSTMTTTVK
jgi:hypothetical protein